MLNLLPVQVDAWYRSGASAIALSVLSIGLAAWALTRLIVGFTRSRVAAAAGAALLIVNPNVLYLQSTPMTEPLLLATTMLAVLFTAEWVERGAPLPPRAAGWAIVGACMTRYEALADLRGPHRSGLAHTAPPRRAVPHARRSRARGSRSIRRWR